jgi:selenide,water dikinase
VELAERSGVRVVVDADSLPTLLGALELARDGVRTGGDRRNREYAGPHVASRASEVAEALAYDPQTAGGLLVSMPKERVPVLEATLAAEGLLAARIGRVEEGSGVVFR